MYEPCHTHTHTLIPPPHTLTLKGEMGWMSHVTYIWVMPHTHTYTHTHTHIHTLTYTHSHTHTHTVFKGGVWIVISRHICMGHATRTHTLTHTHTHTVMPYTQTHSLTHTHTHELTLKGEFGWIRTEPGSFRVLQRERDNRGSKVVTK